MKMKRAAMKMLTVGPLQTNCYFISSGSEYVIIDPGGDFDKIAQMASTMPGDPAGVIATHGHFDHVAEAERLAELLRTEFLIHSRDLEIIEYTWKFARQFGFNNPAPRPNSIFDHNISFKLGRTELLIRNTPGHTPGSISIISGESVFTGDCLFSGNIGRMDLGGNERDMAESLKWFLTLPPNTRVFPGHGPPTILQNEISMIKRYISVLEQ